MPARAVAETGLRPPIAPRGRWWVGALLLSAIAVPLCAQAPLVLEGRVTGPRGEAVPFALLRLEDATGILAVWSADSVGGFSFRWGQPRLPARLIVVRVGMRTLERELARTASGTVLRLDLAMQGEAGELAPITVVARRPRPPRDLTGRAPAVGTTATRLEVSSGMSGDAAGDLDAALSLVPGIQLVPDASGAPVPSTLGVPADQNGRTVNGAATGRQPMPRDGLVQTVRLSTFDPRIGRFGGVLLASTLPSGTFLRRRGIRGSGTGGMLQWAPAGWQGLVPVEQDYILSGTASGPLGDERRFYSLTGQFRRRQAPLVPLGARSALTPLGISDDALAAVRAAATDAGFAVDRGAPSGWRTISEGTMLGRIDLTPFASLTRTEDGDILYLLASGWWRHAEPLGIGPAAARSRATGERTGEGSVQLQWAPYLRGSLLELRSRIGRGAATQDADATLPAARVRSAGTSPGASGLALSFGGPGVPTRQSAWWTWETAADLSRMSDDGAHRVNMFGSVDLQGGTMRRTGTTGEWTFADLQGLQALAPMRYSRLPAGLATRTEAAHVAVAIGDVFVVTPSARLPGMWDAPGVTLQYGVRLEADQLSVAPAQGAALAMPWVGGTSRIRRLGVLPMLGFTWRGALYEEAGGGAIAAVPRHVIEGGVRLYRNSLSAIGSSAIPSREVLGVVQPRLECVGGAIPAALPWSVLSSPPTSCAGDTVQGSAAPEATVLAEGFDAPRSARAELTWRWFATPALSGSVGGGVARNRGLPQVRDLNFRGIPTFRLQEERGRPVYVPVSGVDPGTGAVASAASRRDPMWGAVSALESTAATDAWNGTIGLSWRPGRSQVIPGTVPASRSLIVTLGYTLAGGIERFNGFTASTAGDPGASERAPSVAPRHSIVLGVDASFRTWMTVSASLRLASGVRFTPMTGGDINGDGLPNDRAFVPSPTAADSAVAEDMRSLLARATPDVRSCLQRQAGGIAGRNSCLGPWTAGIGTIAVTLDPWRLGFRERGGITLLVRNALAGLDALAHGDDPRGWGQFAVVDPVLVVPTSFDARRQRFGYAVNPDFGSTRRWRRALQPVVSLMVDLRLDVGRNLERQALEALVLRGNGGDAIPVGRLRGFLLEQARRARQSDSDRILEMSDSLLLSPRTLADVRGEVTRRDAVRDSIYGRLADELERGRARLGDPALQRAWRSAILAATRVSAAADRASIALLTDAQRRWMRDRRLLPSLDRPPEWLDLLERQPQVLVR